MNVDKSLSLVLKSVKDYMSFLTRLVQLNEDGTVAYSVFASIFISVISKGVLLWSESTDNASISNLEKEADCKSAVEMT